MMQKEMPRSDEPRRVPVVAIVGSAGGIRALQRVLAGLLPDLDACVLVVIHLAPLAPSVLAAILGRQTSLHVEQATGGAVLTPGVVLVAPPDAHVVVEPDE